MRKPAAKKDLTPEELNKLRNVRFYLLDMDGTIYLETTLLDGTLDFLAELAKQGKRPFYITNNSSKGTDAYIEKLAKMGIPSEEEDFCTSAHATIRYLNANYPGAKLFVLGTRSLADMMEKAGFTIVTQYEKDPEKRPDLVVLGFDTSMTYEKLKTATMYIQDGLEYISTHPDAVCPYDRTHSVPDAGSFIKLLESSTGKSPKFIAGKPEPAMIDMVREKLGCKKEEIAVVGDRLNTDIASAINAGVISICVLTGETTEEDLKITKKEPDYVFKSIKELWQAIK